MSEEYPASMPPLTAMPPTARETAEPQRGFTGDFYGDTADEIEQAALAEARKAFGDSAQLEVKRNYLVMKSYGPTLTNPGAYHARITVLAPAPAADL